MDIERPNKTPYPQTPGKPYFIGLALFIVVSTVMSVATFLSLALSKF